MQRSVNRRCFLKMTAAASSALFLTHCPKNARKPNIIYILADDLGYGDLGCYGQKAIQTPNLDKMAEEGMRFTNHYAGSTVCAPSRCCLMTGYHTGHARVRGNDRVPLEPQDITVANLLKQAGYSTALIGKWGLGEPETTGIPNRQGFDYFLGYLNQTHAHNYYPDYLWQNLKKIKLDNENIYAEAGHAKGVGSASINRKVYSHDLFTQEAISFLEQNADRPFFLYLAYTIPHANNEHHLLNRHGMEVPDYGSYANASWPEPQKGHAAMITRMDNDIGQLLQKLRELAIDKETIVIFSSDNGPHREGENDPDFNDSNGPLKGIKRDLYEGGIRVPFIVRWPEKIRAGSASDHVSAFWDFLPTACDLADVKSPDNVDGISFVPALLGEKQAKHEYLYWEFHERKTTEQAVRMENWKAVRHSPEDEIELYDLESDVGEENNIASMHSEIVKRVAAFMNKRSESAHWPLKTGKSF